MRWKIDDLILLLIHDLNVPYLTLQDVNYLKQILIFIKLIMNIFQPLTMLNLVVMLDLLFDYKHVQYLQYLFTESLLLQFQ